MTCPATEKEETEALKKEVKAVLKRSKYQVFTILRHVSSSGMFRRITAFTIDKDGQPYYLDYAIEKFGLYKRDNNRDGLRVSGCGMDMGFEVVYNLSSYLYGHKHEQAYKLKQRWL